MPVTRRASRDAALVELQRLHAAILASRARRGVGPDAGLPVATLSRDANAAGQLTRRLQAGAAGTAPARDAPAPTPRSHRRWWLAMGAVAIVGAAGAALMLPQRGKLAGETATSTPDAAPPREAAPAAAPAPPAKAVRVTLETMRPVWMRITVDGVRGFEGELPAGEKLAVEGDRDVKVRAGDAGGVRTSVNGVDRGPLGRNGWPLTVSITPEGIAPLTPTRPEP